MIKIETPYSPIKDSLEQRSSLVDVLEVVILNDHVVEVEKR